ncbi:MAG: hypothetical protein K9I29_02565 [Bacteroidales bacterium]|nr:hypothetical protein [Bacteroidales bacterium]MCF8327150.1 hypothetical protein [Bacteroidales bacterium]
MTEKQIEKTRKLIKKHRAALAAEKRKFGAFDDSVGRRYYIAELYMRISDYKGTITYKKWFDKNFPDDIGSPLHSLYWSIAYFELGKIPEAKIYTIDTAFQNIYLHELILDREVKRIDMYEHGLDMLEFAKSRINIYKKVSTQPYLDWLSPFIDTDEYKEPVNKFIELNKLLKAENDKDKRIELVDKIRDLENMNRNRNK